MSGKNASKETLVESLRNDLDDAFTRRYLRRDQLGDVSALLEAHCAREAMDGDVQQRREILESFLFYVDQHSANTWQHEGAGSRFPYVYARYVADCIRQLVKEEKARGSKGRPQSYSQDEIAAAVALLNRYGVKNSTKLLAKALKVTPRTVEMSRAVGGYEIKRKGSKTGADRYGANSVASIELLKVTLGRCAPAVSRIVQSERKPAK
jgi:hypothetical protein